MAVGSLGTETVGSITLPASYNNIVGIKPSRFISYTSTTDGYSTDYLVAVGLTSRHLVIPISQHHDSVGVLTRTVKDAAYILQVIAGVDLYDNYTSAIPNDTPPQYIAACDLSALSGSRIGIPRNVLKLWESDTTGPILEAFENSLRVLSAAGATIIENTNFTAALEYWNSTLPYRIQNADFVVDVQTYLDTLSYNPNNITSLADLRSFTRQYPAEEYPLRDTSVWDEALSQGWNNTSPEFWPNYQQSLYYGNEGGVLGTLKRHNLDAVVLPAGISSLWATVVGSPVVTVPMGSYPDGVSVLKGSWGLVQVAPNIPYVGLINFPIIIANLIIGSFGISFLGAKFSEFKLVGLAYAFEQLTQARDKINPYKAPRIDLEHIRLRL